MPELPAVVNNVQHLERVLADPDIVGIPLTNIVKLLDVDEPSTIAEQLAETALKPADTLLVYYSGHGLIGKSAHLLLSTSKTKQSSGDYSALDIETVRSAIRDSPARTKILILDCCFSGRAIDIMAGESDLVRASMDVKGTYAIASAPATKPASAPAGARYTAFTGAFLATLEHGVDDGSDELTVENLFQNTKSRLARNGFPEPQRINFQGADKFCIAKNRYRRRNSAAMEAVEQRIADLSKMLDQRLEQIEARVEVVEMRERGLPSAHERDEIKSGPRSMLALQLSLYFALLFPFAVVAGYYLVLTNGMGTWSGIYTLLIALLVISFAIGTLGATALIGTSSIHRHLFGRWIYPQATLWGGLLAITGLVVAHSLMFGFE